MKSYIEERALEIARYIIDNNATVRQAAEQFVRRMREYLETSPLLREK